MHASQPISNSIANRLLKPELALAVLMSFFGLMMVFIVPPIKSHDEWNHFYRAYDISRGHMTPTAHPQNGEAGSTFPTEVILSIDSLLLDEVYSIDRIYTIIESTERENEGYDPFTETRRAHRMDVIKSSLTVDPAEIQRLHPELPTSAFVYFPNTSLSPPLQYIPQAIGIGIGRALGLKTLWMIYAGRICNLLFAIIMLTLAMRLMPTFKWALFILALSPVSVLLSASLSPDSFVKSVAFMFIALVLRSATSDRPASTGGMITLCLMALVVALSKAYFMLPLIILMIPASAFGSTRRYVLAFAITYAAIALSLAAWGLHVKDLYGSVVAGADPAAQMKVMAASPVGFLGVVLRSLWLYKFKSVLFFFGHLSHNHLYIPAWLAAFNLMAAIAASLVRDEDQHALSPRQLLIAAASLVLSVLAIYAMIYIASVAVGSGTMFVQGRYLIPLSPLGSLLIFGLTSRMGLVIRASESMLWACFVGFVIFSLIMSLWVIASGYYAL